MRRARLLVLTAAVVHLSCGFWVASSRGELLLNWTFEEAASGDQNVINRGTAAGADGIFQGGALRTDNTPGGASRGAADLLAMGDGYVSAADSSALNGLEQITITAWINLQGDPPSDGSVNDRVAALQDATAAFNGFSLNINAPLFGDYTADNFRLGMFVGGTNGFAFSYSEDIFDLGGEWVFIATTYDGLSDLENLVFYLGTETMEALEHFFPLTANAGPIAPVAPDIDFHVGHTDGAPTANTSVEGFIDDVRIYDEILSLEQIEAVRLEGLTEPPPVEEVPGDYNNNGRVEQADLDLVLLNWGGDAAALPAEWVNTRPTDGIVDQAELDGVLLNWGNSAAIAAVPEPASVLMGLVAALAGLLAHRQVHKSPLRVLRASA